MSTNRMPRASVDELHVGDVVVIASQHVRARVVSVERLPQSGDHWVEVRPIEGNETHTKQWRRPRDLSPALDQTRGTVDVVVGLTYLRVRYRLHVQNPDDSIITIDTVHLLLDGEPVGPDLYGVLDMLPVQAALEREVLS